jgi:predicted nucleotidyltransferase
MKTRIQNIIQLLVIKTSFYPFTFLYRKLYYGSVLIARMMLGRIQGVYSLYLRRGLARGEIVYGLSDIDLLIVINDEHSEATSHKLKQKYKLLSRFIIFLGNADRELAIYSVSEFLQLYSDYDFYRGWFNEGKTTWKLLAGFDIVNSLPALNEIELKTAAIEEFKVWWSHITTEFTSCNLTPLFKRKYLWYKAIADVVKAYLFILFGEIVRQREVALTEVSSYLLAEEKEYIDTVIYCRHHLTGREILPFDELLNLYLKMACQSFQEIKNRGLDRKNYRNVLINLPDTDNNILASGFNNRIRQLKLTIEEHTGLALSNISFFPKVEFNLETMENYDIDTFNMALITEAHPTLNKLQELRVVLDSEVKTESVEPYLVFIDDKIAFSIRIISRINCIKSAATDQLFFSILDGTMNKTIDMPGTEGKYIECLIPRLSFRSNISKRTERINKFIYSKNIYRLKEIEFIKLFWAAARTKMLYRSLDEDNLFIPITSRQINEMLKEAYPENAEWLQELYIKYSNKLAGEESEAYKLHANMIDLLIQL